jgi:glycine oxidase
VIGLYCALRLQESGGDVTVIDGSEEDWTQRTCSASRAAAGMLAPVSERVLDAPSHPNAGELAAESFALWRKAPSWLLQHASFSGALLLGATASENAETAAIDRAEMVRRFGVSTAAETAAYVAHEGVIAPLPAMQALAQALRQAGGVLHFDREAQEIQRKPYRRVRCHGGATFTADHVVIAPGVWAHEDIQTSAPALRHIRAAQGSLALARLSAPLKVTVRAADFYLAPRGDDAVIGSTMVFDRYDRSADPASIAALFAAADRDLPGQVTRVDAPAWAGVRAMSPDWAPMIGPSGDAWIAAGHSRNGWLLAPLTAEIICAYVFGRDQRPLWAAFHPDRFERPS